MKEKTKRENLTTIEAENTQPASSIGIDIGALFLSEYRINEQLPVAGGEADVYKLVRERDNDFYILKLYRYGIYPKVEVMDKISALNESGIVKLIGYGSQKLGNVERFYKIQEFILHGSLEQYCNQKRIPKNEIKSILSNINKTLSACHNKGIIHRDIKPSNILLRNLSPPIPVISDFGIASVLTKDISRRFTSRSRTVDYAAPEALSGLLGKEMDYWSLGVILTELLTGKHPFENMSDGLINLYLTSKPMPIPEDIEEEWVYLLKGLLTRDFKGRWGYEQVNSWLVGKYKDIPLYYEGEALTAAEGGEKLSEVSGIKPYHFNNKYLYSTKALTEELVKNHQEASKHLLRGYIGKWVEDQLQDYQLKSQIVDLLEDGKMSPARKLSVFIYKANPSLPLTFKDKIFTEHNLSLWLRNIIGGNKSKEDEEILAELFHGGLFQEYMPATNKMSAEESKEFGEKITYAQNNICRRAPFPTMSSAYIFLLLVNEDARKTAFEELPERICTLLSKVLNGVYKDADKEVGPLTKWVEPSTLDSLLIVLFLRYGRNKIEKFVQCLGNPASLKGLNSIIGLLEDLLTISEGIITNYVTDIIGKNVELLKKDCADLLAVYVVCDEKIINKIRAYFDYNQVNLEYFKKGIQLIHLLKKSLSSGMLIKRDDLRAQLQDAYGKLSKIMEKRVVECPENNGYRKIVYGHIKKYIPREIKNLTLADLHWLKEAEKILQIPQPSEFIEKNVLKNQKEKNKDTLESLLAANIPTDEQSTENFKSR